MSALALLRHDLPDGSWHVDLLVGPPGAAAALLDADAVVARTWRCLANPAEVAVGTTLELEQAADHRALYLSLDRERTLDGGRGRVTPLARGSIEHHGCLAQIRWSSGACELWLFDLEHRPPIVTVLARPALRCEAPKKLESNGSEESGRPSALVAGTFEPAGNAQPHLGRA
jgi:hypothetical protein